MFVLLVSFIFGFVCKEAIYTAGESVSAGSGEVAPWAQGEVSPGSGGSASAGWGGEAAASDDTTFPKLLLLKKQHPTAFAYA